MQSCVLHWVFRSWAVWVTTALAYGAHLLVCSQQAPATRLTWISTDANIGFFSSITHFTLQRIVLVKLELTHSFIRLKNQQLYPAPVQIWQTGINQSVQIRWLWLTWACTQQIFVTEILKPFVFCISELSTTCHNSTSFARMVRSWTSVSKTCYRAEQRLVKFTKSFK